MYITQKNPQNILFDDINAGFKRLLKRELSSNPASSIGNGSDYESEGGEFESHCGQDFLYIVFERKHSAGAST